MNKSMEKRLHRKLFKRNGEVKKERRPLLYFIASFILPKFYRRKFGLKFMGLENIPKIGRFIIASSHVTAHDPLFIGCTSTRAMHFMAKAELFKNRFVSRILTYAGAFPVERGTGGEDSLQYAKDLLNNDRMLTVFIEGTRSKDGQLGRPKTGVSLLAYETNSMVVPCAVIGENGEVPKNKGKARVNFGKPMTLEEMGIEAEGSMYYRRGAKRIMAEIAKLREEGIEDIAKNG